MAEHAIDAVDEQALADFITSQRWYGSKSRAITRASVIDTVPLRSAAPGCSIALVEARFQPGTHETYQVLLGRRPTGESHPGQRIDEAGGWTVYEGLADPAFPRELVRLMEAGATVAGGEGAVELRLVEGQPPLPQGPLEARAIEGEQSNSSIVLDEAVILKVYRRLEAGINPELELLRFLTVHDFANVAALRGWYQYSGLPLEATLGILQDYVESHDDGWSLVLDKLGSEPDELLGQIRRLGEVTGTMHTLLGSDSGDTNFAPEDAGAESLAMLVASVDAEIERVFLDLPELDALGPIAGRGEDLRDQLRALSHAGSLGRMIRHHGDYHLGQVLWTGDDWIVLDFEGEPARSLTERRQKRSPLRDVAGMLRSFAYVSSAAPMLRGGGAPGEFERRLRAEFLAGYLDQVDTNLLPSGREAVERLLTVFELEKAVYELSYELDNRPEWIGVPVASIERMLDTGVP